MSRYPAGEPSIIMMDDIMHLSGATIHKRDDGRTMALLRLELRPEKQYTLDNLRLYLTDGVHQRFLSIEPEPELEESAKKRRPPHG